MPSTAAVHCSCPSRSSARTPSSLVDHDDAAGVGRELPRAAHRGAPHHRIGRRAPARAWTSVEPNATTTTTAAARTKGLLIRSLLPATVAAPLPTVCSTRLITTGATAARSAVNNPTHGGGRPSERGPHRAQRVGRAHDRAVLVDVVDRDDGLGRARHRDAGGRDDDVFGGADGREVEVVGDAAVPQVPQQRLSPRPAAAPRGSLGGGNDDTSSSASRAARPSVVEPTCCADGGDRRPLVRRRQRDHVAERRQTSGRRLRTRGARNQSTTIPPCECAMRSTSRPGCSRCMARSCPSRRCAAISIGPWVASAVYGPPSAA